MDARTRQYLSEIGARGGRKSRRTLSSKDAQQMVKVREARRAYKRFSSMCFWSYRADLEIGPETIAWVAQQLRKHGNWEAWRVADRLCR